MNLLLAQEVRHCTSSELLFQYTSCDQNSWLMQYKRHFHILADNRWLFAVPRSHNFLCTPESMPAPQHGLNCSLALFFKKGILIFLSLGMSCPAGHFLEMHSQQCRLCQPGESFLLSVSFYGMPMQEHSAWAIVSVTNNSKATNCPRTSQWKTPWTNRLRGQKAVGRQIVHPVGAGRLRARNCAIAGHRVCQR